MRGLYALWQPGALAAQLVEDGGGAPRLAGWVAFLYLATIALAWAMFQGTWVLAAWTAFKPLTLGFAQPVLAVSAALVLVALSRPVARLLAGVARVVDRRWRRGGRRTLLRPRAIFAGAAALALATAYLAWRIVVRPRLGPLDTSFLSRTGRGARRDGRRARAVEPRPPPRARDRRWDRRRCSPPPRSPPRWSRVRASPSLDARDLGRPAARRARDRAAVRPRRDPRPHLARRVPARRAARRGAPRHHPHHDRHGARRSHAAVRRARPRCRCCASSRRAARCSTGRSRRATSRGARSRRW